MVQVPRSIRIVGDGATRWEVPAGEIGITVLNGAHVRVFGIRFSGDYGGIWVEDGDATVAGSSFAGFTVGIADESDLGSLVVDRSAFTDNMNGIYAWDGVVVQVSDSRFYRNRATNLAMGAGIAAADATLEVTSSIFANNGDEWSVVDCGTCDISDSLFLGNDSGFMPMVLTYGDAVLERNRFCFNTSRAGGAVQTLGSATLRNNLFLSNTRNGGVLDIGGPTLLLEHNTFVGNDTSMAFVASFTTGNVTMVGNLVTANDTSQAAFVASPFATVSPSYNAWYDNLGGNTNFGVGATDIVGVDPLIPAPACTWASVEPGTGSPLVDGDPTLLDADGSPADIGATGGPSAP